MMVAWILTIDDADAFVESFSPTAAKKRTTTTATTAITTTVSIVTSTVLAARRPFVGRRSSGEESIEDEYDDADRISSGSSSSHVVPEGFQLDPTSDQAKDIVYNKLGLSSGQHDLLIEYANCIVEWNSKINLVSRKDCCLEVVFGRHILPCLAPVPLLQEQIQQKTNNDNDDDETTITIIDVGTGGGFPGIPLAIALLPQDEETSPNIRFVLMDSIRKKCMAVEDMVDQLGFTEEQIQVVNTRAEDYFCLPKDGRQFPDSFDWCVGRSVTAIQQFATWVQHLMKPDTGKLLYIQGGNNECPHANLAQVQLPVHDVLFGNDSDNDEVVSDKNILIYDQPTILSMATPMPKKTQSDLENNSKKKKKKKNNKVERKFKIRGQWAKKNDPTVVKQRGYENFQRWDSSSSSS